MKSFLANYGVFAWLFSFTSSAFAQTVLSSSFEGTDLSGQTFQYTTCNHAKFVKLKALETKFIFSRTMRFCNFDKVEAIGAKFDAYLYQQYFFESNLTGAQFVLRLGSEGVGGLPSVATFKDSNLEGASFVGDVSTISFINSNLKNVTVNGVPCNLVLKACMDNEVNSNE